MKTIYTFFFLAILVFSFNYLCSQEDNNIAYNESKDTEIVSEPAPEARLMQPEHNIKTYTDTSGKVYFQKSMPVYLWVSTSPNEQGKTMKLNTANAEVDHFYLDTEGKNTIRSPWLVDPETGKKVTPHQDVIFDIYADGIAPSTNIEFLDAKVYRKSGKTYYGKNLKIKLVGKDRVSGVEETYVAINKSTQYSKFDKPINMTQENQNTVSFYSIDHVGNTEVSKTKDFIIDITAPETKFELVGNVESNVLSPNAKIKLKSSDNLSGVKKIKYKIGDGDYKTYTQPISLWEFTDGDIEIEFYAVDNVENQEDVKSTSDSKNNLNGDELDLSSMKLYVDREAPETEIVVHGDQHEGKYFYASERTKIEIKAKDNKAGIDKITYGVNVKSRTNEYSEQFNLNPNAVMQYVNYSAVDKVKNWAKAKSKLIYLDKTAPKSTVSFSGKKFNNRDTLFITDKTKIKLTTYEAESGTQAIKYSLDNSAEETYKSTITVKDKGYHKVKYYGVDNVNNKEDLKEADFVIDNAAPTINYSYSVEPIGIEKIKGKKYNVLPSNTMVYLAATDDAVGVMDIQYSINGGEMKSKSVIKYFKPGIFTVDIVAYDFLGNKTKETIRFKILE